MHVLTKIFIVLVALLSVMLVPLVVVYAKNEANFKAKYQQADELSAASALALQQAETSHARQLEAQQGQINSLNSTIVQLRNDLQQRNLALAGAESDLNTTKAQQAQLNNQIKLLATSVEASQQLTDQLVSEAGSLRSEALQTLRQNAELTAAIRESDREREVLEAAVRSLKEEVQRLSEAEGLAIETIARYEARHGALEDQYQDNLGVPIDKKVIANIIDVRQSEGLMLAEIDAGQRDGVQKGWIMTIGDGNGEYVGRLRIIDVDVNRAVGIAENAGGEPAMNVSSGFKSYAFPN